MKLFFAIFLLLFISPLNSLAHEVEADNGISAVVHIDPRDTPVAGEVSTIYFNLKDPSNNFNLESCDCSVVISSNNQEVARLVLTEEADSLRTQFVFPTKNLYSVSLRGLPKTEAKFKAFDLKYNVQVELDSSTRTQHPHNKYWFFFGHGAHMVIFCGGFIALAIIYLKGQNKN